MNAPELTSKFAAATFEHDTTWPVNGYAAPQLNTHAVVNGGHLPAELVLVGLGRLMPHHLRLALGMLVTKVNTQRVGLQLLVLLAENGNRG